MAKRDPDRTARNRRIAEMTTELREMLPWVLAETGWDSEASLNAKIGGKSDEFIDLRNEVITSPEHYASLWLEGLGEHLSTTGYKTAYDNLYETIKASPTAQQYLMLFLQRSYLKHYDELAKKRPTVDEAAIWIGQNNAHYGLLVTPRFHDGQWENDKSEIRHFRPRYWSIGHVLTTGLVIPGKDKRQTFADVDAYLDFFENVLVRHSGSKYQIKIAERYSEFVRAAADPHTVPLLIPELRYAGLTAKHKYRLDFCVIDPMTMNKVGFELSPWSSHGELTGLKGLTQKAINELAAGNFEKEMKKHKDFFRHQGIFVLIYTDTDLADINAVFADIAKYLVPASAPKQLKFHILSDFFK